MSDFYLLMESWSIPETTLHAVGPFDEIFNPESLVEQLRKASIEDGWQALAWVQGIDNLLSVNHDEIPSFDQFKADLIEKANKTISNIESYIEHLRKTLQTQHIPASEKQLEKAHAQLAAAEALAP